MNQNQKSYQEKNTYQDSSEFTLVDPRIFDQNEITEIHRYIDTQIPHTTLNSLFALTNITEKKAKVFCTIFRLIDSARDYCQNETTRKKIDQIINRLRNVYREVYPILDDLEQGEHHYKTNEKLERIKQIMVEHDGIIDHFTNLFLVFAEKQELISGDKVSGLDSNTDIGKDTANTLRELVDKN